MLAGDVFETITVTTALDIVDSSDREISLREAITQANQNASPTIIKFSYAVNGKPILLSLDGPDATAGDLDITQGNLTIQGSGRESTIISAGGSESGIANRIFHVQGTANVTLMGLTIRGGRAEHGAGILHSGSGDLKIRDALLTDNTAINTGGAIAAFSGSVDILDSTIQSNTAAFGGGIGSLATVSVIDTAIAGNVASSWGGGVYSQGPSATTTIKSSTFSDNSGIGGGLVNRNSTSSIEKSTFSGNRSISAGAILNIADSAGTSSISIQRSTLANNHSGSVGSVHTMASIDAASAPLTFGTSLFVGNLSAAGRPRNVSSRSTNGQNATLISTGRNLLDDHGSASLIATDIGSVDTMKTPVINRTLADNGGATKTHALLFGSPALGAGGSEFGFTGQRGPVLPKHLAAFSPTDIGAYQLRVPEIDLSVSMPQVSESDSTTLNVVAESQGLPSDLAAAGPITVQLKVSGSGVANIDFALSGQTIMIPRGSTSGSVTLTAIDDPIVESEFETITLEMADVSNNSRLAATTSLTVQLQDDDQAGVTISGTDVHPHEATAQFEIQLSRAVDVPVRVGFRTNDGQAVAGVDFEGIQNQVVEFAAGQTRATIEVPLTGNTTGNLTFTGEVTWIEATERKVKHVSFVKTRLSQPVVIGDVKSHLLSDDGSTVIYVADQDTFEVNELYSVPADGSAAPIKLNAPLGLEQNVSSLVRLSANGEWVVYQVAGANKLGALISARTDGSSSPLPLTPPHQLVGARVNGFAISPDGRRVVYRLSAFDGTFDLYSVPISGMTPATKLNDAALKEDDRRGGFQFSADGTRCLYIAREQSPRSAGYSNGPLNLFSVSTDGSGPPIVINSPLEITAEVHDFSVSAGDNTVVYVAGNVWNQDLSIYSAPVDGSAEPIQLTTSPPVRSSLDGVPFAMSADGSTVVYLKFDGTSNKASLHSVQTDGQSPPIKLEGTSQNDYNFREPFAISSDGGRLVYVVSDVIYPSSADKIISVAVGGTSAPIELFREPNLSVKLHALSPDAGQAFFSAIRRSDIDKTAEFYSVATDGSSPATKIVDGLPEDTQFTVSEDGSFLIYQTIQHSGGANELHRVALDEPSNTVKLNGELVKEDRASTAFMKTSLSANGSRILYRTPAGYYVSPTDGSAVAMQLDMPAYPQRIMLSPNGRWVVFESSQPTDRETRLFAVPTDRPSKPILLSTGIPASKYIVHDWFVTPNSTAVVYKTAWAGATTESLYSVPIDGASSPIAIHTATGPGGKIRDVVADGQGRHIAFVTTSSDDENAEVYTATVDGSSAPTLVAKVSARSRTSAFAIPAFGLTFDPNGRQLAFLEPQDERGRTRLYLAPLDGASPPLKWISNDAISNALDVLPDFRFTADASEIVYRAYHDGSKTVDLYSVFTDGNSKPIKLNSPILLRPTDQEVLDFVLSADGESVLYRTRNQESRVVSLVNARIDGTALPFTVLDSVSSVSADSFYGDAWERPLEFERRYIATYSEVDYGSYRMSLVRIDQPLAPVKILGQPVRLGSNKFSSYNGQFLVPVRDEASLEYLLSSVSATGTSTLETAFANSMVGPRDNGTLVFYTARAPDSDESPLYSIDTRTRATIRINDQLLDFGDAPPAAETGFASDYPVTAVQDGARHQPSGLHLGQQVDAELDGQPHRSAGRDSDGGDDQTGRADEDGVTFLSDIIHHSESMTTASLRVIASNAGKLDAWMDFNRDGDWDDIGEQIYVSESIAAGSSLLSFNVPELAMAGETAARFRLSTLGGLSATGFAADGEVEDYLVNIVDGDAEKLDAVFRLVDPQSIAFVLDHGDAVIRSEFDELFRIPTARLNKLTIDVSDGGTLAAAHMAVVTLQRQGASLTVVRGTNGRLELPGPWQAARPQFIDAVLTHRGSDTEEIGTGELRVATGNAWQNPFDIHDVDGNGHVEPIDALTIINALNQARQSRIVLVQPTHAADIQISDRFWDVSGDEVIEPYDALLVVNHLNFLARPVVPQGEAELRTYQSLSIDLSWLWDRDQQDARIG